VFPSITSLCLGFIVFAAGCLLVFSPTNVEVKNFLTRQAVRVYQSVFIHDAKTLLLIMPRNSLLSMPEKH
jgi:hypothetical protein